MASYTIAEVELSNEELISLYRTEMAQYEDFPSDDLNAIFEIAVENRDRFPGITGARNPEDYVSRWVKKYVDAINNPPSQRIAKPKSTCTDPAIRTIVQKSQGLSAEEAEQGEYTHNLFMSAENIQGNLLEEYIARNVRPYGFLWCGGNVLRAIDFCNTDGSVLLQVKNKYNTENSSSSNIREGTTIEKWYRLGERTKLGRKIPYFKWETLNEIINRYKTEGEDLDPCNMTEESYQAFLSTTVSGKDNIICNQ